MKAALAISFSVFMGIAPTFADAGACDYRPSALVGSAAAAGAALTAGAVATAGGAAKAAGVYTLVNATTGATMVGGTWAGASAAGTAGILAGTSGAIGTVAAVVTAPATISVGAVFAAVVAGYEGACYFQDSRITDYDDVDAILANIALTAPVELMTYDAGAPGEQAARIRIIDPESEEVRYDEYEVKKLYIVNGVLKNRDWFRNTTIGNIGLISNN